MHVKAGCSVAGCENVSKSRGWCQKHYARWLRYGDPLTVTLIRGDDDARFDGRYRRGLDSECWPWTDRISKEGYGCFVGSGQNWAHRWSYQRWNGLIPKGWNVDHLCHNADPTCKGGSTCMHRRCVNPAHLGLEPTVAANALNSPNAPQHRTHCPSNHPYDERNTYIRPNGGRVCRRCRSIKQIEARRNRH